MISVLSIIVIHSTSNVTYSSTCSADKDKLRIWWSFFIHFGYWKQRTKKIKRQKGKGDNEDRSNDRKKISAYIYAEHILFSYLELPSMQPSYWDRIALLNHAVGRLVVMWLYCTLVSQYPVMLHYITCCDFHICSRPDSVNDPSHHLNDAAYTTTPVTPWIKLGEANVSKPRNQKLCSWWLVVKGEAQMFTYH